MNTKILTQAELEDPILTAIEALGITMTAKFVPFSQSRNKAEKSPSLNWVVTISRNDREILSTEYMAGCAHCPSYNTKPPKAFDRPERMWPLIVANEECERGFKMNYMGWMSGFTKDRLKGPILPDIKDVLHSLILDASVLGHGSFESWAEDFGYTPDSRKAESIYRACLDIALKLRNGIGETGLAALNIAFQDY